MNNIKHKQLSLAEGFLQAINRKRFPRKGMRDKVWHDLSQRAGRDCEEEGILNSIIFK